MKIYLLILAILMALGIIGCANSGSDQMDVSSPQYSHHSSESVAARMISPVAH